MWDPKQYARFGDERSRPFYELVAQIGADDARTVVDLGCGPGGLTASLANRFISAQIIGVDNDPAMLRSAATFASERVRFEAGDIATWMPSEPVDVLVSNAALQWDLDHLARLPTFLSHVVHGGWFAFQVPGNLDDAHHQAIRALRREPHWASIPTLAAVPDRTHVSRPAAEYLDALARLGCKVDAWETTYAHILTGPDPVLEWVKGTALRPVLDALPDDDVRAEFLSELAPRLREAYPSRPYGTPFPFRRVFVVAQKP